VHLCVCCIEYRPPFPPECDERLRDLITELWSSDPRDRPSAQEAADRIESMLHNDGISSISLSSAATAGSNGTPLDHRRYSASTQGSSDSTGSLHSYVNINNPNGKRVTSSSAASSSTTPTTSSNSSSPLLPPRTESKTKTPLSPRR
jgi:hypothetical protein